MRTEEALAELAAAGTEQTRKVYRRHGVSGSLYGVSYAVLGKLTKRIKTDHALAQGLWASGNHDARVLATMVADAGAMTPHEMDAWVLDLDSYVLADAFSVLVARSPLAREKHEQWRDRDEEHVAQVGWSLLAQAAMNDPDLTDDWLEEKLAVIEREIHGRKNRVRHSMNGAVIAIGLRNPALRDKAVAAAGRIGKVEVDHGDTSCTTPDVAAYINKALASKAKRAAKKAAAR